MGNYIGPDEGVAIYVNGEEQSSVVATTGVLDNLQLDPSGVVVVGRTGPHTNSGYVSAMVDELMFFNRKLTPEEAKMLYQANN